MTDSSKYNNAIYRYPGVQPFKPSEGEIFFGRERDKDAFYNFILSRQMVVLYGKSGYGKSSLINAGVIPRLQVNPCNVYFSIRFNNYLSADLNSVEPVESLNQKLRYDINTGQQDNTVLSKITNNEKTFWFWLKQIQKHKQPECIVLFFDQFEELFTYPAEQINNFSEQLAEAIYTSVPVRYRDILAEAEEQGDLKEEELNWLFTKPFVRIVLSIRSDRMSLLNQISDRHTSILSNCYELLPLSEEDAKEAIIKPAEIKNDYYTAPAFTYAPELVTKILKSFKRNSAENIETNILQIICRYIEEVLVIKEGKTNILAEDVGEISNVLYNYYENILNKLGDKDRHKAQQLIEEKLITGNQRNSLSEAFIKKEFAIDDQLLARLEESSLLRKERDASGRLLYEVSHDTLVEPIQKVAEVRLKKENDEKRNVLEHEIQEEKKRVIDLEMLNQKVRIRSRIAMATAILGLIIACFAYFLYMQAEKEKKKTLQTLKNLNFKKAQEFYTNGNQYFDYAEYELALRAYSQSMLFLDSLKLNQEIIPDSAVQMLKRHAKEKIDFCENKLIVK